MCDSGLVKSIVGVENKLWSGEGLRGDVVFGHKGRGDIKRGGAAIQQSADRKILSIFVADRHSDGGEMPGQGVGCLKQERVSDFTDSFRQ